MKEVVIVGYGVVGKNIEKLFQDAPNVRIHISDPTLGLIPTHPRYDYAIICVPTEMREDRSADTSIVTTAIRQISADLYIIKSTVPPGFTRSLSRDEGTGKKIHVVFSPEYYGGTQHANTPKDFVIFGGDERDCRKAVQLWQEACTGYSRILTTDFETAELVKYAENAWLASQVVFFNTFWRIAKKLGVDFTNFREALLLDERISRSHSLVYDDHPYYDSHCMNKDLPAIVKTSESAGYFPEFIQSIIDCNSAFKAEYGI